MNGDCRSPAAGLTVSGMGHFGVRDLLTKNRHSRASRNHTALVYRERSWTYEELDVEVTKLASGLTRAGFTSGDRLAVLAYNCPEYVISFFAAAHLGAVIVPLNYLLEAPEVVSAVEESGSTWLVVGEELGRAVKLLPPDIRTITLGSEAFGPNSITWRSLTAGETESIPSAVITHDQEFLYQFSSGTTGVPKAAIHTHGTVLMNALLQVAEFGITSADTHLVVPALCWGAGFHDYTLATWWQGGTVVLNPSRKLDVVDLQRTIRAHQVSTVLLVPSIMRMLLDVARGDIESLCSLRIILSGGEPVPAEAIRDLQESLPDTQTIQAYGLSEFPVITTYLDGQDAIARRGSAGKATLGAIVRVVDEDGKDVRPGEVGEIISKSLASMIGYTGIADESGTHLRDGWLFTGDRARVDEDGFIYIAGRKKDMIISGGLNVYPAEVEKILASDPAVKECAVVGVPDQRFGEVGLALLVAPDAPSDLVQNLQCRLREEVGHFKIPKHWIVTHTPLPRTASGKVQKYLLQKEYEHHPDNCTCASATTTQTLSTSSSA